jgi:hypothetical protein
MTDIEIGNITINIVELCSELASKKLLEYYQFFNSEKTEYEIEDMISFEIDNVISYKEEAQDMFNDFYDDYWDLIMSISL